MKIVFIGGSRQLGRLNKAMKERTDNIISSGYLVLVGDANGADKAVQTYLAEKCYPHVIVFCAGATCRNNIGQWETRHIQTHREKRDFKHYAIRDKRMGVEADYGLMLWDGNSKGTLNNIVNLLEQHKSVLVYFSPKRAFYTLKTFRDLETLLALCNRITIDKLEKALNLRERVHFKQSELDFA